LNIGIFTGIAFSLSASMSLQVPFEAAVSFDAAGSLNGAVKMAPLVSSVTFNAPVSTIAAPSYFYHGCFVNTGSNRITAGQIEEAFEPCAANAKAAGKMFFGMEFPACCTTADEAQCRLLDKLPSLEKAPESDCEDEVSSDGHALGGSYRLAVYSFTAPPPPPSPSAPSPPLSVTVEQEASLGASLSVSASLGMQLELGLQAAIALVGLSFGFAGSASIGAAAGVDIIACASTEECPSLTTGTDQVEYPEPSEEADSHASLAVGAWGYVSRPHLSLALRFPGSQIAEACTDLDLGIDTYFGIDAVSDDGLGPMAPPGAWVRWAKDLTYE